MIGELIHTIMEWVALHGKMPRQGRIDRRMWLDLYDDGLITTVLDGNTVIWLVGIPFREDYTLGYKIVEFDE